jgi:sulfocyanin SoxE-like protein
MLISTPRRSPALFLTGLLGVVSLDACSKQSDHPGTVDSASSSAQIPPSDTTSAGTDSSTQAGAPASSTATAPQAAKSDTTAAVKAPAKPKPSIDPGRKPAKRVSVPRKAVPASSDSTAASTPATTGQDKWLKFDAASNTVTFELIAGPFTFNGFSSGGGTLTVPSKANMVINFANKDGTPHSAEVISGEGPIPNAAVDPAIPRAYTNKVLEGLPQEATDVMRFTVPESGTYRIFCGVPGHGLSGMWIWFKVDPAAKAPSFGPTKS